jgi:hypothetical protein
MSSVPPFELPSPPLGEEPEHSVHDDSACRVLTQGEIAALLDFFLLLDEWDRRRKII